MTLADFHVPVPLAEFVGADGDLAAVLPPVELGVLATVFESIHRPEPDRMRTAWQMRSICTPASARRALAAGVQVTQESMTVTAWAADMLADLDLAARVEPILRDLVDPADWPDTWHQQAEPVPAARVEGSLGALVDEWLDHRVATGTLQPRSAQSVRSRLAGLTRLHGDLQAVDLDRRHLAAWQATTGHYSPAGRAHMLSAVRGLCAWMLDEGHITVDPTGGLGKVRQPRRVPRALSRRDASQALAAADADGPRTAAIVGVMLYCGLRCAEVAGLDVADWDREKATLLVRKGKGGHERTVPVPAPAGDLLEAWLLCRRRFALERTKGGRVVSIGAAGARSAEGPLFVGVSPRSPVDGRLTAAWVSTYLGRLMAAAGLHRTGDGRTAHAFRHTCASDVLDTCHDLRTLQGILGQVSLTSTEVYLRHADLDRMRAAMEGRQYEVDQ